MDKKDTRLAIIDAALEVFARKGFEKATLDEVAARAKIAKGTIFYNFKSKEDLFFAIIEQGTHNFVSLIKHDTEKGTATEKIDRAYDSAFQFFQRHNYFCTLLMSELWRVRSRWNYEPKSLVEDYKRQMESIFLEGQQSGEFRKDIDPEEFGLVVFYLAALSSMSKTLMAEPGAEQKLSDQSKLIFLKGIKAD